jgi:hypothetical protein
MGLEDVDGKGKIHILYAVYFVLLVAFCQRYSLTDGGQLDKCFLKKQAN